LRSLSEQSGSLATVFDCDALSVPITFDLLVTEPFVGRPDLDSLVFSKAKSINRAFLRALLAGIIQGHLNTMLSERLRISGETNTAGSHASVCRYKTALASVRAIPWVKMH